jgi:hypothetical protein
MDVHEAVIAAKGEKKKMNTEMIENTTTDATVSAQSAAVKPTKVVTKKSATPKKDTSKGKKGAKATKAKDGAPAKAQKPAKKATKSAKATEPKAESPREGSKTAQVVAMLQRKGGATLPEIMAKMGWQKHTVRGFMAGAMKKAGITVESFKPEGGERTYRINQ